ncbi:MAG: hypothetical protein IPI57_15430 [Candidatus Competibacteraceae bacterium]|nr:hypothetical protein [Candidatus Competibacteraceae bacterium]
MNKTHVLAGRAGAFLSRSPLPSWPTASPSVSPSKQNEHYGCCIVKTPNKAADTWEYEDDISFGTCYKWARADRRSL